MHCAVNHVCTHVCGGRRTVKESVNLKEGLINLKVLSAQDDQVVKEKGNARSVASCVHNDIRHKQIAKLNDVEASNFFSSLPSLLKTSYESGTAFTFAFTKFNKESFQ